MFEAAELEKSLTKEEFDAMEPELRTKLIDVQHRLKSSNLSVLVIIAGVEGSGKGDTINLLHEWMDPRFLVTTAFGVPSAEEKSRPEYWRYWRKLPPKGRIGVFFGSWYTQPIVQRLLKENSKSDFERAIRRINDTEKMLTDDKTLIIKFWFHISKAAQKARFKKLESNKKTAWRVTKGDWKGHKQYDRFIKIAGRMIHETSTAEAPWTLIDAKDEQWRNTSVAQQLIEKINARLEVEAAKPPHKVRPMAEPKDVPKTILDSLDMTKKIERDDFKSEYKELSGRLNSLCRKAKEKGVACVLAFEGWDAAGKGGAIRRVVSALDARDYRIVPIAAPTSEELAQQYLWRFWRYMPPSGKITIFDRTWYGRVLVERVEGFARKEDWQRAYSEINAFERQLYEDGVVFVKYWLHIDSDEQLNRFKGREATPWKQFKITEEDYRNREKIKQYLVAVNEMVERTSTEFAPWTLVEANDKLYGRIKVVKTFCDQLEKALE